MGPVTPRATNPAGGAPPVNFPIIVLVIEVKPTLTIHDGKVLASSRDVAAMFGKRHDNVLRDIDALIKETGILNFKEGSYTLASTHPEAQVL